MTLTLRLGLTMKKGRHDCERTVWAPAPFLSVQHLCKKTKRIYIYINNHIYKRQC